MKINKLINNIEQIYNSNQTLIIAIDGLGGAGKTTISQNLYESLKIKNYNVITLHIDDFIHPKAIRYNNNYEEWQCYFNLQWRYDYFLKEIITPIKNGQNFHKNIELYNKNNDIYYLQETNIPIGSIVIVEGVFLQRKELNKIFDYIIYIDVSEEIRLNRVIKRDNYIGNKQQIQDKYKNRYFPAEHKYFLEYTPNIKADYVIKEC